MLLYRIYTENKNYDDVISIVRQEFEGFTVIKADGCDKRRKEHSLVVEVITANRNGVLNVAYAIKKRNEQDSVLVIAIECDTKLIQ